ncbi:MAG: UDP-2,3-diacylglucosamine diphosphatase LpxI [Euryhalocaulis sp.]|uniref:LpxI family protein n=1 Tax=Euryhalocaulis sp. TaxID=2744307 RepID=UPI0017EAF112|nr:UDP-2,3-diacylglucosamine diphosphatase LpxI [Euryhalocaulis sp.]MBA4800424.1 UDP-2,3-diacylglucosamine diphosphatase LpxI [Euryhalocaulis sp.]
MLGLIAGAGELPVAIADGTDEEIYVVRLKGLADPALEGRPGGEFSLGQLGGVIEALKSAGVARVMFAGYVDRPDFSTLKPDWRGARALPRIIAAATRGDDALLRAVLAEFEREGFEIVPVESALETLLAEPVLLTGTEPREADKTDIETAIAAARAIGALDIGQAAVACDGLVLAVEAQEGTDAMLRRVAGLPSRLRGSADQPRGVLAKAPKPVQDRRVDLPAIGVQTVQGAAAAGLAGIAVEAGGALIINKAAVAAAADAAGIFVMGVAPDRAR